MLLSDITLYIGNGDAEYSNVETEVDILSTFVQRKFTRRLDA